MSDTPLPHDDSAEAAVLGSILLDNNVLAVVQQQGLLVDHFYREKHQHIYRAMRELAKATDAIDTVTVSSRLNEQGKLQAAGGGAYLIELSNVTPAAINAPHYAKIVLGRAEQREALNLTKRLVSELEDFSGPGALEYVRTQALLSDDPHRAVFTPWEIADGFLTTAAPPQPALLKTFAGDLFMPKGRACMLAGAGGVGKTRLLVQLAVSVASDEDWLGLKVTEPGHVLLACGEEGKDDLHRRIHEVAGAPSDTAPNWAERLHPWPLWGHEVSLVSVERSYGKTSSAPSSWYLKLKGQLKAAGHPWSLIILDPATRFMGPDVEIDNKAATEWVRLLEDLARTIPGNPTVLIAHHVNKGGIRGNTDQSAARGSSALTDGVRWQANLEIPENQDSTTVTLRLVKGNYGPPVEPIKLKRGKGGVLQLVQANAADKLLKKA